MYILCILPKLTSPSGGQFLRHNMFNCVLTAIEAPVDVPILIAVTVFQAFKQIRFVTWEHSVDILGPQTICKSLVIRECGLFLFEGQYIFIPVIFFCLMLR